MSGSLAAFGQFQQWGYQHALNEVNAGGGIEIGGHRRLTKLVILDDASNPNTAASNVETLISRYHVVAVLGSCTPQLVNAGAIVAERQRIPMVTGCDPVEAFLSIRKWEWVWDLFFDEPILASLPFRTLHDYNVETNHTVAILHDNGPDGEVVGGKLWPELALQNGYKVAANVAFPIDATNFDSALEEAKSSGADIVMVDTGTPQAVSIRRRMSASGYTPKVMVFEKGGEPVQFATALKELSDGVLVGGYWDSSLPYPGAAQLTKDFESETGQTPSQHIADSFTAANVLLDAIARAGSTDRQTLNAAIGQTDATYVAGPVHFEPDHAARLNLVELQWQNGATKVLWPRQSANASPMFPNSGAQAAGERRRPLQGYKIPQMLISGLLLGGIYAIAALGLSLVLGVLRLVNLAHGEWVLFGSYLGYVLLEKVGIDPLAGLVLMIPVVGIVACLLERLLLAPLRDAPAEAPLLTTLALSAIAQNAFIVLFTANTHAIASSYGSSALRIGPVTVPLIYPIGFACGLFLVGAMHFLLSRSSFGRQVRATGEDPMAAAVVGAPVGRIRTLAYGMGAGCAAMGGVLSGIAFSFTPTTGSTHLLTGFAIIVLGGSGRVLGVLLGGIAIGVVESLGATMLGDGYRDFVGLAVLLIFLALRPQGIFGKAGQ